LITKISRDIARTLINNSVISFDEISVYQYGIELALVTFFESMGLVIFALMTGRILETTAFVVAFTPLRLTAGGYHAKTVYRCFLYFLIMIIGSIAVTNGLSLHQYPVVSIIISFIAVTIIFVFAPADVENRRISITEESEFRNNARLLSLAYFSFVCIALYNNVFAYYVTIFSIGMLMEAFTLIKVKTGREN